MAKSQRSKKDVTKLHLVLNDYVQFITVMYRLTTIIKSRLRRLGLSLLLYPVIALTFS
jgi:hypothetical protein